jgi:hypothetical protein
MFTCCEDPEKSLRLTHDVVHYKWQMANPYKPIDAIYGQPQFSLKIYKRVLTIEYLSVYVYNNDIGRSCKVYFSQYICSKV